MCTVGFFGFLSDTTFRLLVFFFFFLISALSLFGPSIGDTITVEGGCD